MAQIIEDCITIRVSKLVRNDAESTAELVSEQQLELIDATLQEVLDLEAGVVVEVQRDAG